MKTILLLLLAYFPTEVFGQDFSCPISEDPEHLETVFIALEKKTPQVSRDAINSVSDVLVFDCEEFLISQLKSRPGVFGSESLIIISLRNQNVLEGYYVD